MIWWRHVLYVFLLWLKVKLKCGCRAFLWSMLSLGTSVPWPCAVSSSFKKPPIQCRRTTFSPRSRFNRVPFNLKLSASIPERAYMLIRWKMRIYQKSSVFLLVAVFSCPGSCAQFSVDSIRITNCSYFCMSVFANHLEAILVVADAAPIKLKRIEFTEAACDYVESNCLCWA